MELRTSGEDYSPQHFPSVLAEEAARIPSDEPAPTETASPTGPRTPLAENPSPGRLVRMDSSENHVSVGGAWNEHSLAPTQSAALHSLSAATTTSTSSAASLGHITRLSRPSKPLADKIPAKQLDGEVNKTVDNIRTQMGQKSVVQARMQARTQAYGANHSEVKKEIAAQTAAGQPVDPELIRKDQVLTHVQNAAPPIQKQLASLRQELSNLETSAPPAKASKSGKSAAKEKTDPKASDQIRQQLFTQLGSHLKGRATIDKELKALGSGNPEKAAKFQEELKHLDSVIKQLQTSLNGVTSNRGPAAAPNLQVAQRQIAIKKEIAVLENKLNDLEQQAINELGDEHAAIKQAGPILAKATGDMHILNHEIGQEADHFEDLSKQLMGLRGNAYDTKVGEIASKFLEIGMWPPKSSQPFSKIRQDVAQSMLTQALEQHPPSFVGDASSGGVYRIFADVKTTDAAGNITVEKREVGCFKPDDEAPGGMYARTPDQETVPGLDHETASIRQALVSRLGTASTTDSILATAAHPQFKYFQGEARENVDGKWQGISAEAFQARNEDQMPRVNGAPTPTLKQGVFMEWIHDGKSMWVADHNDAQVHTDLMAQVDAGQVDSSVYDRIFEDVAFLNWDPNIGNQLLTPSSGGELGKSLTWRQVDMDKAMPSGFIAGNSNARWAYLAGAGRDEPLPEALAAKAQAHHDGIEGTIVQAKNFWNQAIDQKIAAVKASDMPKAEKKQAMENLKSKQWSEAQSNTLRATSLALKAAVDLGKTPKQLFSLIENSRVGNEYTPLTPYGFGEHYHMLGTKHEGSVMGMISELHVYNDLTVDPDSHARDIPSRLALIHTDAKAAALTHPDVASVKGSNKKQEMVQGLTNQFMMQAMQDAKWWS